MYVRVPLGSFVRVFSLFYLQMSTLIQAQGESRVETISFSTHHWFQCFLPLPTPMRWVQLLELTCGPSPWLLLTGRYVPVDDLRPELRSGNAAAAVATPGRPQLGRPRGPCARFLAPSVSLFLFCDAHT